MSDHNSELQLVTFQLGAEYYGIDIMQVKSIEETKEVRPIPNSPAYVEGIFNLRGEIIPVINLHKRFHLARVVADEDDELLRGFLIIRVAGMHVAIIIDKVSRVLTVNTGEVQQPPQMISGIGAEYIEGVVAREEGYLIILDIDRLFNMRELAQLETIAR
ncbi:chemotaxis protein CheW [Alkalispirochaeta alkalica]|uniref:chemotaxis protein CheW n=1 Tax=Alkalispirochaeta alkalica TaxID=46356 RepID=UPI00039EFFC1|nr:chemotaxis protein CheW [Alkalispirochaeta alkalica]